MPTRLEAVASRQFRRFMLPGPLPGWRSALVAWLLALAAPAQADQLALDVNDDAARLSYAHVFAANQTQVDASLLRHQERGNVLAAGFHLTGNAATQERPVNAGVGGRLMYVDADGISASGGGLAVGGFFDVKIPDYNRFGVGGHVYYAPDVLSFGDVKDVVDVSLHASYSILRNGEVYVGLRNVKSTFDDGGGTRVFDTGLHIGFRLNF